MRSNCYLAVAFLLLIFSLVTEAQDAEACPPSCTIPDCKCSGPEIPGNLTASEVPQIVLLTFDDAVNAMLFNSFYKELLELKNPNGCPIGMTFFVSHEYCDYSLVHRLWDLRHEIASHSISHKPDQKYWESQDIKMWIDEFVGMRDILEKFGKVPKEDVKGIRVPFLKAGGDVMFEMLEKEGFLWDCSMPTRQSFPDGYWPYSLKYKSTQQCQVGTCPTKSFPNLWVIPMLDLSDENGFPCAMLDTCVVEDANATYKLLMDNFKLGYGGNRAPFGLYVHAAWFMNAEAGHFDGYLRFLKEIQKLSDVYFVTVSQALEYTRYPVDLNAIKDYAAWKTQCTPKGSTNCDTVTNCRLIKEDPVSGGERYMPMCGTQCPAKYPWVGNPLGQ